MRTGVFDGWMPKMIGEGGVHVGACWLLQMLQISLADYQILIINLNEPEDPENFY